MIRLAGIMPLIPLIVGCSQDSTPEPHRDLSNSRWSSTTRQVARQTAPEDALRTVVSANNEFAFRLLRNVRGGAQSVFISPASIFMAFSMTMNGARGHTLSEMQNALGLAQVPMQHVNIAHADVWPRLLQESDDFVIRVANAIFIDATLPFEQSFLDTNANYYGAELQVLDFENPATVTDINEWANKATNGNIPKIIDVLQGHMLICNAIYFKAKWVSEFDEDATKEATFTKEDGSKLTVDMMYRLGTLPYSETSSYQAIRLAYKGGHASMIVVLPKGNIKTFADALDSKKWDAIVESLRPSRGHINLPRFTTRFDGELKTALQALGMTLPFESRADFGKILKGDPVWISRVIHKAFLDVGEKGTEAAAATAVEVKVASAMAESEKLFVFRADRPFIYSIVDDETGLILFLGIFAGA